MTTPIRDADMAHQPAVVDPSTSSPCQRENVAAFVSPYPPFVKQQKQVKDRARNEQGHTFCVEGTRGNTRGRAWVAGTESPLVVGGSATG